MSKSGVRSSIGAVGLVVFSSVFAYAQDDAIPASADIPPILKIGAQAPDFDLPGIDGKNHSLKDYAEAKVLAIVFTCDHCPVASMYEKRIKQLTSDYANRGVKVVAIMPNDPKAIHLSELGHTDLSDTLPEMKLRAQYRHFNFPYLSDGATQKVALQYGPVATPHIFIFDQQRKLRYEGRIDSNSREELVTKHEARDALDALIAGKPVAVDHTPAVGCSTKWAYKEAGAKQEVEQGEQEPVKVDLVSAADLKALRKNSGTGRLLLVNFWATWCGPCTAEFPELQKMIRQYRKRDLTIVTVSINAPDEKNMVLKFLNEQHAIGKNLIFNSNDAAEAVPAFETDWTGAVPYTALIGMNGEVLFKNAGGMNALEVRRAILKHLPDDRYVGQHAYWNSVF
jgi:peroxiredoxin